MANTISATDGYYADRLAESPSFIDVLKGQMIKVALNIKAEALNIPQHQLRSSYATSVLNQSEEMARRAATTMVQTAALLTKTVIVDGIATTTATEADIFAGVTANWTILAGGDTGS